MLISGTGHLDLATNPVGSEIPCHSAETGTRSDPAAAPSRRYLVRFSGCYDQDVVPNAFESDGIQAPGSANRFRSHSSDGWLVPASKEWGNEAPDFVNQIQI